MPLSLDWHEIFASGQGFRSRYILSGDLDVDALERLGLPKLPFIGGVSETNLILTRFGDGRSEVLVSGDLSQAVIAIPHFGWLKPAGRPGNFRIGVMVAADGAYQVDNLTVTAGDLEIVGKAGFGGATEQKWHADFAKFRIGKTDVTGSVIQLPDDGFLVRVHRGTLDLESVLHGGSPEARETDAENGVTSPVISFDVNLDTLRTGQQGRFGPTKGEARLADGALSMLAFQAGLPNGKFLHARYEPDGEGHKLEVQSNDAGQALVALGWSDKLERGELAISGKAQSTVGAVAGIVHIVEVQTFPSAGVGALVTGGVVDGYIRCLATRARFHVIRWNLRVSRTASFGSTGHVPMDRRSASRPKVCSIWKKISLT